MRKSDVWIVPAVISGVVLTALLWFFIWFVHDLLAYGALVLDGERINPSIWLIAIAAVAITGLSYSTHMLETKTARNIVGGGAILAAVINMLIASLMWVNPPDAASISACIAVVLFVVYGLYCFMFSGKPRSKILVYPGDVAGEA